MSEPVDYRTRTDRAAFAAVCCEKYADEFAAFCRARRINELRETRDILAADLATAQKALEEASK